LPLDRARIKTLAVVGPNARPLVHGGAGSAFVTPLHSSSLLDAIEKLAPGIRVVHHPGLREVTNAGLLGQNVFAGRVKREIFLGTELAGAPVSTSTVDRIAFSPSGAPAAGVPAQRYSIRWTGALRTPKAGKYTVMTNADDGVRVTVAGKRVIEDWTDHAPTPHEVTLELAAGLHDVVLEYYQNSGGALAEFGFGPVRDSVQFEGEAELSKIAKSADAVIVCAGYGQSADTNSFGRSFEPFWPPPWARTAGLVEAEDSDRPFEWPRAQIETIRAVSAANSRVVVVGNAGGGVAFDGWLEKTPSLLWAWYPGQEGGTAIAEVLFGEHNPSGKLPVTFARAYADHPSAPFYSISTDKKTPYSEGVFVGYRGFDARHVEPQFPFGHGLSYTEFAYKALRVAPAAEGSVSVELSIENQGPRAGSEIAQVYVAPPSGGVPRPPQELKGYARVELAPGESRVLQLSLGPRAFAHWAKGWSITAGSYEIRVGASSRDLRLSERIELAAASLPLSQAP
ncbi:MAG: glycoside hydrolase family 3 C-terminal domain-containing protein, partial [Deltaproteobacteria bacterium]